MSENNNSLSQKGKKSFVLILILLFFLFNHQVRPLNASNQTIKPLFSVKMIVPTSSTIRIFYEQLIEEELPKIGIEAELDYINQAALGPRVTDQEVGAYNDGGYDIALFSLPMGSPASHQIDNINSIFGAGSIPPYGYNVMYWSPEKNKNYNNYRAQESEALIKKINANLNLTETIADFIDWQKIWYDTMPMLVIYNQYQVHAISVGMYGYDPQDYPLNSLETIFLTKDYTGSTDTVVCAVHTGPATMNFYLSDDIHSEYVNSPVMDSLYGLTPSKDIIFPKGTNRSKWMIDNFNTDSHYVQYPRMAASMGAYTTTGPKKDLEYNVTLRDDVLWHDGHLFDAWDVAFSFQAVLTPVLGISEYSNFLAPFGKDDKVNRHGNYSFIVEDKNNDNHYEHISFQLNATYGALELHYIGGFPILPEHILGDPEYHGFNSITGNFDPVNTWQVKPANWASHSFNTGRPEDPGGLVGPIGTGSMVFKSFNPTTSEITLEKFENIKWNNPNKSWIFDVNNDHFLVKDGKLNDMPKVVEIIATSMDGGLAEMKAGNVNIMDPQFFMYNIYEELQSEVTIQTILTLESGWSGLYFNPKFEQDEVFHLNKRGVRHAISHIIPREDIIEYVLNGFGLPAYTPIPRNSWAVISEEQMITFKRGLFASNGSQLLTNSSIPYDTYSVDLALDWLASEGYNVEPWRNPPSSTTKSSTITGWTYSILFIMLIVFTLFKRSKRRY
ncbi:MAG: ABC transporter substrate-binding protein [Candidatus Hodarchaeota archaeon]